MKENKVSQEDLDELYETILCLKNKQECEDFFADLCSVKEVGNMSQRLKAAKLLMKNKTFTQTTSLTNVSSATLSRISKCIQNGNGYKTIFNRKQHKKK